MKIIMNPEDTEKVIEVPIIDNAEWEPDLDFLVELYDLDSHNKKRLDGKDTQTRVTILDEDMPGTICFDETAINVYKKQEKIDLEIKRVDGSDG
jgi:hypothetical protein